jgi:UDP-glucose:(heptosyl)LPS alpha-1,3-glucosyltransferase
MRIAFALEHLEPTRGGLEHWTVQCVRQLTEWGHEVHVAATSFAGHNVPREVRLHPYPAVHSRRRRALKALEVLSRLKLDVIHDCGVGIACDVLQPHGGSRWAMHERARPWVSPMWQACRRLAQNCLPRARALDALQAFGLRTARFVIAVSNQVRADLVQFHGVPAERIRLVYNGVDVQKFCPSQALRHREQTRGALGLRDEVLILLVAHNPWLKGVPTLLHTFARLRAAEPSVRLAIVGGKPRRVERMRRWAEAAGVRDGVRFIGAVPDVLPWLGAADVYVHPTLYDPCSLVTLEALACGLPVVTTRRNGVSELMQNGREGLVLDDPTDVAALEQALRCLLDESMRREMGCAARALALSCDLEQNVRRVVEVYNEVGRNRAFRLAGSERFVPRLERCAA